MLSESKRGRRRTQRTQQGETLLGFLNAWKMTRPHPPKDKVGFGQALKPLTPMAQNIRERARTG